MGKSRMYTKYSNDDDGTDEVEVLEQVFPKRIWGFGFVHNIDFHHWRSSLKRILLQKINPRKRLKGKVREKELDHDVGEQQKLLNDDQKHFLIAKDTGRKQKRSLKARIKSLISEENGNKKSSVCSQPKLHRTYSIHHLEPPDPDWESPIFFFSDEKDIGPTKLWDLKNMKVIDKPDAHGKKAKNNEASKDKVSFLENFKANKNLFLESLQDTDSVGLRKFSHSLPGSRAKARLTKSGSYPNPASLLFPKRDLEPSTLRLKRSEIWPAPKGEKLNHVTVIPKAETVHGSMHFRSKSLPSEYRVKGSKLGQELDLITETSAEPDERNIEENHFDEGSPTCRVEKENENEENGSSGNPLFHRRSSSLNDSLDKYARLFGNDLGKDANLGSSRSLKLRNEYEAGLGGGAPILFGRIWSLSHLESYSSIGNVMPEDDVNLQELQITAKEESRKGDCPEQELEQVGHGSGNEESVPKDVQESIKEHQTPLNLDNFNQTMANISAAEGLSASESVAAVEDLIEEADKLTVVKSNSFREQETSIAPTEFAQPCSVSEDETCFREVSSTSVEQFQDFEGVDNEGDHDDVNSQKSELSAGPANMPYLEKPDHDMKKLDIAKLFGGNDIKQHENTDLDYVKAILEYSGFGKDAVQKTWYSSNQPLDPSVFIDMEAYLHNKEWEGCYHHQLLFDIINEKLLNVYDRSFAYYPKALSSSCHIHPFPIGDNIVDEICKSISPLTSLKPEQKQSLECIVGLDMAGKDEGWMNLQMESECLALELEELIFEELMEDMEDMIFEQVFGS
ncbi:OLC1v1007622C1 [Oldenlandia corymbosa var. corymbosa]|uniref:OLC1v1007622C1 n=1 Tax=Oldenlandia corymbosa var. corymbosa TaxID=529605 RepID=A0AAV1DJP3_OLDCO|nr:OLC1v1007622C1 [Oldenlandia corymbosa var. corymbosa]